MELTSGVWNAQSGEPRIQFLYFASCPNAQAALSFLRETLQAEDVASDIEMITVETDEAAQRYGFVGSPTIRVNGVDVVPPPESAIPSLACRLYPQVDGHYAPHPPAEALTQALRKAHQPARDNDL